jgi:5'(3')-deoxyribonucleotidase
MEDTNRENQDYKRTVYVDMDGVIADFDRGFYEMTGMETDHVQDNELWAAIDAHGKARFFSELPWMPGGKELWQFVTSNFLKVKILSALGKSDKIDKQTTQGKLAWLRHNIPNLQLDDIILVDNKHRKRHYSKPGDIIIDDTPVVIEEWLKKGGIGILHKTASDTIGQLKRYV